MREKIRQFKAKVFQALAHPTRIAILELLHDGEMSAGAIFQRLNLERANVSQHLAVLSSQGIVVSRRQGNRVVYSVRDRAIVEVLDILARYCHSRLLEMSKMAEVILPGLAANQGSKRK